MTIDVGGRQVVMPGVASILRLARRRASGQPARKGSADAPDAAEPAVARGSRARRDAEDVGVEGALEQRGRRARRRARTHRRQPAEAAATLVPTRRRSASRPKPAALNAISCADQAVTAMPPTSN